MMIEHISPTSLGLFSRCREAFRRRYLCGDIIPPGVAACIGTGVHRAAETNHRQKLETGIDMPADDIKDAARDGFDKAISGGVFLTEEEKPEAGKVLGEGADTAVAIAAAYAEKVAPLIAPVLVEERLTAEVPGIDVPFLGVVDVVDVNHVCRDLKTAGRKWAAGKASTELQPPIYRYLMEANGHQFGDFSFEVLTHKGEHQQCATVPRPEDMTPIIARAKSLLAAVRSGDFPPAEPGHWMCSPKWCGYYFTCPHIPDYMK